MKLGLCAGLIAGLICSSPAVAAPATVTVRVEGAGRTLVDSARVTTTAAPVSKAGHDCSGTSAGGALDRATAGNWDAGYFDGLGHFVTTIMGEQPPSMDDFWSLWVNHKSAPLGACATELQEGDQVLFFLDTCHFDGNACSNAPVLPLALQAPATVTAGSTAQVTVTRYAADGSQSPVAGASVGGAVTDALGHATVSFPSAGKVTLKAAKDGFARSESETVDVVLFQVPANIPAPADRTPPAAQLAGLTDHALLSRGPRELRGSFGADPSGLRSVKLRLTKRLGKRCWYFSGRSERFIGTHCGKGAYFEIGDRSDWSYLLPSRLTRGRYVLDAIAIDTAGNRTPLARGTTRVVFTFR
jgi:Domain of unknown function (DUF4430)